MSAPESSINEAQARACYEVLGLQPNATHHEVQAAYRRLAFRHHPDIAGDDPVSRAEFTRITHAYKSISKLDRLKVLFKHGGCCHRCHAIEELFLGMDRRYYCADCLLNARRRILPLPVVRTIRCVSVMGLQAGAAAAAAQYISTDRHGFAWLAMVAIAASVMLLGYFVFSADQIEA
ncbi:MAG: J domain-containing protein [Phycisphaerae bacterium]|nr:J domain-containing protein [Phycisphaerae bacterium]